MKPKLLICAITAAAGTLFLSPAGVLAAKLTCLTGTDPRVADDVSEITAVRTEIDATCPCASFDGSTGKTHAKYVACTSGVVGAQVKAGNLRTQCKATVKKYYSVSICGMPASKGDVPCIKTSAAGKVTCAIKSSTKCSGTPCASFSTCIAAADTNGDGIIGIGDSGACASSVAPPRFVDNGDGTISDTQTGLMWEKKDQSGGLDDVNNTYLWAGYCSDDNDPCQPDNAAVATCAAAATGSGLAGCSLCGGPVTCDTLGTTTIWHWLNQLNGSSFAGHSDWRIPTVGQDGGTAQLETILDPSVAGCSNNSAPCVPAAFSTGCTPGCSVTGCSCTASSSYWSATTSAADSLSAWGVDFFFGNVNIAGKGSSLAVRAVR
ncbi:MAG: DUF1566 domain-containing protein [Candidatus Binatia bacterium]